MGGTVYVTLFVFDLALLLLATARCTRLVTTDNLPGQWWIYGPLYKRAYGRRGETPPRWARYLEGLTCPFCVGFWIGCVGLLSLWLVGGPGHAEEWWRWLAGAFAMNYVVAHVSARLD
jgi:hypothetical protein